MQSPNNKIGKFDIKQTEITKKDKDMQEVPVTIKYFSGQSRRAMISKMVSNMKMLNTMKARNKQHPGRLKFSKEERWVEFTQNHRSYEVIDNKRVRLAKIKGLLSVKGLDQFIHIPGFEYSIAQLIHKETGYFLQFVIYIPKESLPKKKFIDETIGVDFGCQTAFTLSNGEKISASFPESERLRRLMRCHARKQKGSKNREKARLKFRKEYQKIINRKKDAANKVVHKLTQYKTVVIQDEQIKNWHKGYSSKSVQHGILGKVKTQLKEKPNVIVLPKSWPTTKLCTHCGKYNKLNLWNRKFKCDCGVEMDRDVHAAQNMIWFNDHLQVGMERTELTHVEMEALVKDIISLTNYRHLKHEATN